VDVESLPKEALEKLAPLLIPTLTKYIRHTPEPKQQAFLLLDQLDALYGGAAGGMKSDTLLMAALQYVDIPGYNSLLIRDTYANLNKPEGLLDRAHSWLKNTDAHWNGDGKRYVFPSGATLSFGYLDGPLDHFNFQGAEYQYVGIDEVVNIRENQALYLFSRLRIKTPESYRDELRELRAELTENQIQKFYKSYKDIPLRFRCASNPPTAEQLVKGSWVKPRYIDKETRQGIFIPASLFDNPHIDHEKYIEALNKLDPITRAQLLEGDWLIQVKGRMFDRSWFQIVDQAPPSARKVRFYDPAHTEPHKKNKDPDWFAGAKCSYTDQGLFYIEHVSRWRKSPLESKMAVKNQAAKDGRGVEIAMEREPSAGTTLIDDYCRLLAGYTFRGIRPEGSKRERAMGLASYAEAGNVYLVNGPWIKDFLDECDTFPDGNHDDQVDVVSGGFNELAGGAGVNIRWA